MSNPMLSSWYPADLSFVELSVLFRTPLTKRGIDYNLGKPTLPTPPMLPYYGAPAGCEYMMVRVDPHTGEYPPLDLACLLYIRPKPWNPNDPCLAAAAKEYWSGVDKINKYYQDAHGLNARRLNIQLLRIEAERVACRAGCDFSWGACEAECPKGISITNIARMNREYFSAVVSSDNM